MLLNNGLNHIEKSLILFFLDHVSSEKDIWVNQINRANIDKECTPYCIDLKFILQSKDVPLINDFEYVCQLQIIYNDGSAPTTMDFVIKNGIVDYFIVLNMDGSEINADKIFSNKYLSNIYVNVINKQ